jgi:small subunit ribosomal protein S6
MRRYETIFIAEPGLPDEEVTGLQAAMSTALTDRQGEILKSENWGKRKLAYEVRKHREGHYILLEYSCLDAELPHELERRLRMNEKILRFLTVRIDNDPKRLAWEKKVAQREKERAERRALGVEPEPAPVDTDDDRYDSGRGGEYDAYGEED